MAVNMYWLCGLIVNVVVMFVMIMNMVVVLVMTVNMALMVVMSSCCNVDLLRVMIVSAIRFCVWML